MPTGYSIKHHPDWLMCKYCSNWSIPKETLILRCPSCEMPLSVSTIYEERRRNLTASRFSQPKHMSADPLLQIGPVYVIHLTRFSSGEPFWVYRPLGNRFKTTHAAQ